MKVYHGSTVIVNAPLVGVGRRNLDFGKGFYITDLKEQAISWASRPLNVNKSQILNVYEFDKDGVQKGNYRYKQFMAYDDHLHNMSDAYLVDELLLELQSKQ